MHVRAHGLYKSRLKLGLRVGKTLIIILSFLFLICVIWILQEVAGLPLWNVDGARVGLLFGTLDTIVSCKTFS